MRTGDVWELTCHACGTTHREIPAGSPTSDLVICTCGTRLRIEWRPESQDVSTRKLSAEHLRLLEAAENARRIIRTLITTVDAVTKDRLDTAAGVLTAAMKHRDGEPRQRQRRTR